MGKAAELWVQLEWPTNGDRTEIKISAHQFDCADVEVVQLQEDSLEYLDWQREAGCLRHDGPRVNAFRLRWTTINGLIKPGTDKEGTIITTSSRDTHEYPQDFVSLWQHIISEAPVVVWNHKSSGVRDGHIRFFLILHTLHECVLFSLQ
jgi:hypothetical protein